MIKKTFSSQASPNAARTLAKSVCRFLRENISDPDLLYELELAITEAFSNVFVHAYEGKCGGKIQADVALQPGRRLIIEIKDWGSPYHGPLEPGLCPPRPDRENGRGIYLISQIMDNFQFIRVKDTNILYLEKKLEESP
ncbi:MAG: ATP-binding protein [Desulfohalobiaceae bacterium]|nr:ATP-binding protein [Desulfohalobiaceae bacterium]